MMCACKKGVRPPNSNLEDRPMMASYIPISGVRFISRSDNACPIERDNNNNGKIVGGGGATNKYTRTHTTHATHTPAQTAEQNKAEQNFQLNFSGFPFFNWHETAAVYQQYPKYNR